MIKFYLRIIMFACFMMLNVSTSVHAMQDNYQQPIIASGHTAQLSEYSSDQYPYTDELWLIGSFLASLTGLFILVRFLHR